jgi:HD-like signal output (HDOD) protein
MPVILLSITNPKESVSIKQFLIKNNIQVVTCLPTYSSYIKGLHYDPHLVVSEFPEKTKKEYFNFLKTKGSNPMLKKTPFICYGEECDTQTITELKDNGIDVYIKRPLNPQIFLAIVAKVMSAKPSGNSAPEQRKIILPKDEDIRRLKDRSVSLEEKILVMRNHITKLLAFPMTVANILRVTQNESSGAGDLALIIKSDPAVSAEILKAANSVYFSRGGARISNIKDSIVRIGFMESRKLALSLSVFKLQQHSNFTTGFNHIEFWFHSLAVAIIAERLARNSQLINPEEAFIGGLLHDIGLLLLNEFFNPLFLEILDQSISEGKQFIAVEAQKIGITHNHLMKNLFSEWNFPQTLVAAVPFFNRTDIFKKESLIKVPLAVIITFAEQIARNLGIGSDADHFAQPVPSEILHMMKLPYGLQKSTIENVFTSINTYNQVLNIDNRIYPAEPPEGYISPKIQFCTLTEDLYNPVFDYCSYHHYTIASAHPQSDFLEKLIGQDILILNGVTQEHRELISKLSTLRLPAPENNDNKQEANGNNPRTVPVKMILFSSDTRLNPDQFNSETAILLSYPVDLRTIDGIISCYINDVSPLEFVNNKSTNVPTNGEPEKIVDIGILHSNQQYRTRLCKVLEKIAGIKITEFDPSNASSKLNQIAEGAFKSIYLEFSSLAQVTETFNLFQQKSPLKPTFVIIFKTVTKEDILSLINIGITHFISENDEDESIEKRIFSILTSRK